MDVDEAVLAALVGAAATDAAPGEVTPPLGAGWTPERTAWLWAYHRDRRAGLPGPRGEATWAVVVAGAVVGGARLRWTGEAGVADTGLWLTRSARGHGVGRVALAAVVGFARPAGVRTVVAETSAGNQGALAVLRHLGFSLAAAEADGRVVARLGIEPRG